MTQNNAELGKAIALQMYRLEHCNMLTMKEACMLLGCQRSTLYKKGLPHINMAGTNRLSLTN